MYVVNPRLHSGDWGSDYGRSIASTENEIVMSAISRAVRERPAGRNKKTVTVRLDEAIQGLEPPYKATAIILMNAWRVVLDVQSSTEFRRPDAPSDFNEQTLVGYYRGIPIFRVHSRAQRERVLVLDLARLGRWLQYEPRQVFSEERRIEAFTFYIKAYDETTAREAIQKGPKLAIDPDTKEKQELREAVHRLRQRVHLRILEQFEYRIEDPAAGIGMTFSSRQAG